MLDKFPGSMNGDIINEEQKSSSGLDMISKLVKREKHCLEVAIPSITGLRSYSTPFLSHVLSSIYKADFSV